MKEAKLERKNICEKTIMKYLAGPRGNSVPSFRFPIEQEGGVERDFSHSAHSYCQLYLQDKIMERWLLEMPRQTICRQRVSFCWWVVLSRGAVRAQKGRRTRGRVTADAWRYRNLMHTRRLHSPCYSYNSAVSKRISAQKKKEQQQSKREVIQQKVAKYFSNK